jgi:hypothetical protein
MKTRLIVYCVVWFLLSFGLAFIGWFVSSPVPAEKATPVIWPIILALFAIQSGIVVGFVAGAIELILWIIRKANQA